MNFKKFINKLSHYYRNLKHNRIFTKEKALKNKNRRGIMANSYSICHLDGINEIDTRQRCQKPSNIKLSFIYLFLLDGRFRHSPCPFPARVKTKNFYLCSSPVADGAHLHTLANNQRLERMGLFFYFEGKVGVLLGHWRHSQDKIKEAKGCHRCSTRALILVP